MGNPLYIKDFPLALGMIFIQRIVFSIELDENHMQPQTMGNPFNHIIK